MPEDIVIRRRLKRNIQEITDLRSTEESVDRMIDIINDLAQDLVESAGHHAHRDDRRTLMLRDVEEARDRVLRGVLPQTRELSDAVADLSTRYLIRFADAVARKAREIESGDDPQSDLFDPPASGR